MSLISYLVSEFSSMIALSLIVFILLAQTNHPLSAELINIQAKKNIHNVEEVALVTNLGLWKIFSVFQLISLVFWPVNVSFCLTLTDPVSTRSG